MLITPEIIKKIFKSLVITVSTGESSLKREPRLIKTSYSYSVNTAQWNRKYIVN
ncbi:hypothetical protein Vdis_0195 [Vulcanisaeta distributa DSM 14429]|uniref:Uncharacterized protein n=1 Tax=Vulcanisaeta distributa (strain DSM 14429 / JCM 11212 / NBRC 100878 / IC-017) TaxID=572478 RepID=E1QSU1_VULDI|nr:hypothetical protein Vdis_0195 [Vulcanisaeta distributa DSM 14429]